MFWFKTGSVGAASSCTYNIPSAAPLRDQNVTGMQKRVKNVAKMWQKRGQNVTLYLDAPTLSKLDILNIPLAMTPPIS